MTLRKQAIPTAQVLEMLRVHYWREPVGYTAAYDIQQRLWSQNVTGEGPDALIVLSHPPTFTIGKSGKLDNLLLAREELEKRGLPVFFTDRGGDITYHGPGQVVAYPIIDLRKRGKDVHRYIHDLEEVVVRTLVDFSIEAHRDQRQVGVWVGDEKIAAIGVRIRKWVTMHGLALNVDPIMEHFSYINPCGIVDCGITSITRLLSRNVTFDDVALKLVDNFAEVFAVRVEWAADSPSRCA
jgi:lipoate-protein ligase B